MAKRKLAKKQIAKKQVFEGKFIGSAKGFGFIAPPDGGADIFIPPHFALGAINGDTVSYEIVNNAGNASEGPSQTGKIVKIISRPQFIGIFFTEGNHGYVRPVDIKTPYTFYVSPKSIKRFGLADGHMVVFSVQKHEHFDDHNPPCFITEIIGHTHDPGADVLSLVYQANVPYKFSEEVITEAGRIPNEVTTKETVGRLDLREELLFTIDGDDTKDIDDAISFEKTLDGNYNLGVHIADVTHYVKENTALDTAALERGTSIYLADRVIPMLPHRLSSGICSLFPNVDRLALSCMMTVSPQGNVLKYEIAKTVINSKKRWTYNNVQTLLDTPLTETRDDPSQNPDTQWITHFHEMDTLREILRKKRDTKGALDFNLPEAKIRVDETGKPISIDSYERTRATAIIEEFMILCNETIASHFLALEAPFVYRTHESPSAEKLAKLNELTTQLGFKAPKSVESPTVLQRLLNVTAATNAAQTIATAVLRSLPQARYTPDTPTHYGLASQAYCHFTSPIRRYADLQIHRIIKDYLQKAKLHPYEAILPAICAQCSNTERTAEALEREVEQLKKVQFMSGKEGQTFEAKISGLTKWGVYVMLQNTVEGLIPTENLQQNHFTFDKEKSIYLRKSLKKRGKALTLTHGTPLIVRLTSASEDERKIIFHIAK